MSDKITEMPDDLKAIIESIDEPDDPLIPLIDIRQQLKRIADALEILAKPVEYPKGTF